MTEAEERFKAENGMSSEQAWQYILRWQEEGKTEQVRRGCEEILKLFPDHQGARDTLALLGPQTAAGAAEQTSIPVETASDHGLMGKLRATLQQQRQKFHEMNRGAAPTKSAPVNSAMPPVTNESERLMGAACYLWIFVIIPMLLKRDSQFVQFHAWQGVVVTAGVMIISVVLSIITSPFRIVAGPDNMGIFLFLDFLLRVAAIAIYLMGAYAAYKGRWIRLPVVYPISQKLHNAVKA
jgi:uncharacterized membrane protein